MSKSARFRLYLKRTTIGQRMQHLCHLKSCELYLQRHLSDNMINSNEDSPGAGCRQSGIDKGLVKSHKRLVGALQVRVDSQRYRVIPIVKIIKLGEYTLLDGRRICCGGLSVKSQIKVCLRRVPQELYSSTWEASLVSISTDWNFQHVPAH